MARERIYKFTEGSIFSGVWRLSVPMVASMVLHDILQFVDLFFLGKLGAAYVAGLTMGAVFVETFFTLAMGVSTGTVAMVARYVGADKKRGASYFMLIVTCAFIPFARELVGIFNQNPEVIKEGSLFLQIFSAAFFFLAFSSVLGPAITGSGDTFSPMIITGLIILGLRIPLSYLLSLQLGPSGIWLGMAVSNIIQGLVFTIWFHFGRWLKVRVG